MWMSRPPGQVKGRAGGVSKESTITVAEVFREFTSPESGERDSDGVYVHDA